MADRPTRQVGLRSGAATEPLVRVRDLFKHFDIGGFTTGRATVHAVNGVDFDIGPGETLGLVGESGCGKSTVARCVLQLLRPSSGEVSFAGRPIQNLSWREARRLRPKMQIVFQDPLSSLNPRMKIRTIVGEPLRLHTDLDKPRREARLRELIGLVGLEESHLQRYAHELSGGQAQRVGVARAIATNPDFVVLDEPTSSLDVSVQGQILLLLVDLQQRLGLTYLFISHNLSVIRHVAQRVAVMYLGKIVEIGPTLEVFRNPQHPYTRALLASVPGATSGVDRGETRLGGEVPSPLDIKPGCALAPRCPLAQDVCSRVVPVLKNIPGRRAVACFAATGWPDGGESDSSG